jgi:hypothetical protein
MCYIMLYSSVHGLRSVARNLENEMRLIDDITCSADFVRHQGVTVDRNRAQSWVSFDHGGKSFAFLQGQEADEFNDECERVWNEVGELGMNVVELAAARPYLVLLP